MTPKCVRWSVISANQTKRGLDQREEAQQEGHERHQRPQAATVWLPALPDRTEREDQTRESQPFIHRDLKAAGSRMV